MSLPKLNKPARLPQTQFVPASNRKAPRRKLSAVVPIQGASGERASAQVNDFSPFGCNITGSVSWMRVGSVVTLTLTHGVCVAGMVRWQRNGLSGIEFLRPLSTAQAEQFAQH